MKAFSITTMLLYIAGFVFVLFFFAGVIYPAIFGFIQGECWGVGTRNTINTIKSELSSLTAGGQPKRMTVIINDCVEHIGFINNIESEKELEDFYLNHFVGSEAEGALNCPTNFKGYVIAIPFFEETDSSWYEVWKKPKDFVEEFVQKYKQLFKRVRPFCENAIECKDCYFSGDFDGRILAGARKPGETKKYCLTMQRINEKDYRIHTSPGECK